ncbi:MAG: flagellar protein FlgN [Betaproteobacteria bacterium HGW-Betaproteobacteria-22]|nr:MAG: flagellar protein FlgN [Betaproteobacteria bacterium HGW-Betaproteobacteria-22]
MSIATSKDMVTFTQDAELLKQLLNLLEREQQHLIKADVDAVEAILDEKSVLLQQLNHAAKTRYATLAQNGFEANEAGMSAWIEKVNRPDVRRTWLNFQLSLAQAKELNRLNGTLISKHFNRNQELLNHLQGKSEDSSVYGRDGQSKPKAPTRSGLAV